MTALKRTALVVALFVSALFAWLVLSVALLPYRSGSAGLAAVSFGISEAVVELFVLAVALFIGWRVWRFVQRRRRSRPA